MRPLWSFSNAKAGKYTAKQFLGINLTRDPAKAVSCAPVVFSRQLGRHREIMAKRGASRRRGITLGIVDDADIKDDLLVKYLGPARQNHLK